jgi:hypothetical protein
VKSSKAALFPFVIAPAIMPAMAVPLLSRSHVPDFALGGVAGFFIGLSITGIMLMAKRTDACARAFSKP